MEKTEVTEEDKNNYFVARLEAHDELNSRKPVGLYDSKEIQCAILRVALRTKKSLDLVLGEKHSSSCVEQQIRNLAADNKDLKIRAIIPKHHLFSITQNLWADAGVNVKTYVENPEEIPALFGYFAVSDGKAFWYEVPGRGIGKTKVNSIAHFNDPLMAEKLTITFEESFQRTSD